MLWQSVAPRTFKKRLDIGLGQFLLVLVLPVRVLKNCNMASSFNTYPYAVRDSVFPWVCLRNNLPPKARDFPAPKRRQQGSKHGTMAVSWFKKNTIHWWAGSNGDRVRKAKI